MNLSNLKSILIDIDYLKLAFDGKTFHQKNIYGYINKITKKFIILKIKTLQTIITIKINKKSPILKKITLIKF